jgi:hypothetical protein
VARDRLQSDVEGSSLRRPGAIAVIAVCLLLGGCRSVSLRDGVVTTPDTRYRIGPVPSTWSQVNLKDSDLSWVTNPSAYAFWVDSTCKEYQDVPLVALNRQLLIGFTDAQRLEQTTNTIDGRDALFSHYLAKMDGVARELGLVVLKKDGCIYDFAYIAPPGSYGVHRGEFEALVNGFATEPR